MTLALLPLGLIGVVQTLQLQAELERVRTLNLKVTTTDIARREGEAIDTALGAANALAASYLAQPGAPEACSAAMERFSARYDGRFGFVGFVPLNGQVRCATMGRGTDLSDTSTFEDWMSRRTPFVVALPFAPLSQSPAITVFSPVFDGARDGAFLGLVALSIVDRGPLRASVPVPGVQALDFLILDHEGRALDADRPDLLEILPDGFNLQQRLRENRRTFVAPDAAGVPRRYAIAEAVSGTVYVVGTQPAIDEIGASRFFAPEAFPLVMWVASLILVFAVLETSLVGPVRTMAARMRQFGTERKLPGLGARRGLPNELRAIHSSFSETAERLIKEEADLEGALYDKDVLLKEVHHRVKNNLQMISSMINLQLREVEDAHTLAVLEKVSGRIASLASVHRQVYASEKPGAVRADEVLREVVVPLSETILAEVPVAHRPELQLDVAPARLTPDQAVPMAMLVVEALTTALRWTAESAPGDRWVRVDLREEASHSNEATPPEATPPLALPWLTIRITCNPDPALAKGDDTALITLGERLIRGFARQLRGQIDLSWDGDINVVSLRFQALPFSPDPPQDPS